VIDALPFFLFVLYSANKSLQSLARNIQKPCG